MSKPQFTITLGRSGQVVKRGGETVSNYSRNEARPVLGSKRSMAESSANNSGLLFSSNKRRHQEGGGIIGSRSDQNGINNGYGIDRNDLRLKLMRKRRSKQIQSLEEEERKKSDLRQKGGEFLRQVSPKESVDDLYLVHSMRNPSPYQGGDGIRSPDALLRSSRPILPPRHSDDVRRVTCIREDDNSSRDQWLLRNSATNVYHRLPSTSIPVKMKAVFQETSMPSAQLAPMSSNNIQQKAFHGEESLTVSALLHSLGLGKFAIHFQAEEIDMIALRNMSDKDLKELGIPMGPRKKILLALLPRFKRQPP